MAKIHRKHAAMRSPKGSEVGSRARLLTTQSKKEPLEEITQPHRLRQVSSVESAGHDRISRRKRNGAAAHEDETTGIGTARTPKTKAIANNLSSIALPREEQLIIPQAAPAALAAFKVAQSSNQTPATNSDSGAAMIFKPAGTNTSKCSTTYIQDLDLSNDGNALGARENRAQLIDVDDINAARSVVEERLKLQLSSRQKNHAYLTETMLKVQRRCQEREIRAQHNLRKGLAPPALAETYEQPVSPFEGMSSIMAPFHNKSTNTAIKDISQEIFKKPRSKDKITRSAWVAPTTPYKSDAIEMPLFKEFVCLKNNILIDNVSKMLATPYFEDDYYDSRRKLLKLLPDLYEMKHDKNALLDLRSRQCRFYKESAESFLRELDASWNDVLFWLLAPEETIKNINETSAGSNQFEKTLLDRSAHHTERFWRDEAAKKAILFDRTSNSWQSFFSQLKKPSPQKLRLSSILSVAWLKECHFSIWHLARQSDLVRKHILMKIKDPTPTSEFTFRKVVCVVCHQ